MNLLLRLAIITTMNVRKHIQYGERLSWLHLSDSS